VKRAVLAGFRMRAGGAVTDVVVGEGALRVLGDRLRRVAKGRWFLVSSAAVFSRHGAAALDGAGELLDPEPLLVPDGERAKTWSVLGKLIAELVARGLKRDGGVVALGGGTVGDVAGLAASLALRGVPVVQAPTTLLAASDSALGGKTAVDLPQGKNLAGTVHHPRLVVADTATLDTLPERDYRSGLAEVVKSAMLDAAFHRALPGLVNPLSERRPAALADAILRSLRMKARVVVEDPLETTGVRFALNLGHTVGHALETASRHRLTHGEAVAWGLLAELELSTRLAGLDPELADTLSLTTLRLVAPRFPTPPALAGWRDVLAHDKKTDRKGLRAALLSRPGAARVTRVSADALASSFETALERYNRRPTR
jgi:3-dehydroquinate synthase